MSEYVWTRPVKTQVRLTGIHRLEKNHNPHCCCGRDSTEEKPLPILLTVSAIPCCTRDRGYITNFPGYFFTPWLVTVAGESLQPRAPPAGSLGDGALYLERGTAKDHKLIPLLFKQSWILGTLQLAVAIGEQTKTHHFSQPHNSELVLHVSIVTSKKLFVVFKFFSFSYHCLQQVLLSKFT